MFTSLPCCNNATVKLQSLTTIFAGFLLFLRLILMIQAAMILNTLIKFKVKQMAPIFLLCYRRLALPLLMGYYNDVGIYIQSQY
jgi:hypothetical protein